MLTKYIVATGVPKIFYDILVHVVATGVPKSSMTYSYAHVVEFNDPYNERCIQ